MVDARGIRRRSLRRSSNRQIDQTLSKLAHSNAIGIVRLTWRELADQKRTRHSCGELTPLSERDGAFLLEDIAAVDVAFVIEVIVDRWT
jgi:hypothetical protein